MAIYEISNGILTVAVESRGAELKSLRTADGGKEYLWCGDERYWMRSSPLLFPVIGGLKDGEYRFKGKTYAMPKHGFVKDKECSLVSQSEKEIWFSLEADDETRQMYPFEFKLEIGYRLEEKTLKVLWRVGNPSEENLYFSIGGHPGINCPVSEKRSGEDYYLAFDTEKSLCSTVIEKDGLYGDRKAVYELEDGLLPVTAELFEYDTLVMEDGQLHKISLLTTEKKPYISFTFNTPVLAIWSPVEKKAPFVCIEPWYGICDYTNYTGTWEERKWTNTAAPGEIFAAEYSITVEE